QPTPLGLTKSKSGSPRFNATLFLEAFSLRSMTWRASSCVTSATTIKPLHPSAGSTKILQQESAQLLYEDQTCPTSASIFAKEEIGCEPGKGCTTSSRLVPDCCGS